MAEATPPAAAGFDNLAAEYALSEKEVAQLQRFDDLLMETAAHTNLVARSSLEDRFVRHYADSLQLWPLIPEEARTLCDIGSGGGFPGIVLAILSASRAPNRKVTLCDSVGKKARFLSDTAKALELPQTTIVNDRVEAFHVKHRTFDVITARAVAALPRLLELTAPILAKEGVLIFPKGRRADEELTAAETQWRFTLHRAPSHTDPDASILVLRDLEPKT